MINPRIDNWCLDIKPLNGLLYFSQRWEEMLFDYSLDSHRYRLFNVPAICNEILLVFDLCKINILPWKSLISIREELLSILEIDEISKKILGSKFDELYKIISTWAHNGKNREEIAYAASVIIKLLNGNLHKQTKLELYNIIKNTPEKRRRIDRLSSQLLTETIRIGYSEQYLLERLQQTFFGERPVGSVELFNEFFQNINGEMYKYTVYISAPKTYKILTKNKEFIDHSETFVKIANNQDENDFLTKRKKGEIFLKLSNIVGADPYAARNNAIDRLKMTTSFIGFLIHKFKIINPFLVLVYKEGDKPEVILTRSPKKATLKRPDVAVNLVDQSLLEMLGPFLNRNSDAATKERILGFLRAHAAGTRAVTPEDQFTNLWIAFETLIGTPLDEKIIDTILTRAIPVLCLKYFEKLIISIHLDLIRCIENDYLEILNKITLHNDDIKKCLDLIVSSEYKDTLRAELYALCETNPLLLNRIFRFHELFNDSKSSIKLLEQHEKRVRWHLRRMYRFRNALVHSGQSRTHLLKPLVENLHSYIDHIFDEVIGRLKTERHHFNLDKIYFEYQIDYSGYKNRLLALSDDKNHQLRSQDIVFTN